MGSIYRPGRDRSSGTSARLWDSPAMPEDHFGPGVAERYDEWDAQSSMPEVVEPIVDFLAALAGRTRPAFRRQPRPPRFGRVGRGRAGPDLPPPPRGRRPPAGNLGPVPLRLAPRARPHGPPRRDDPARALGRLEARAVHER